jgi:hypothetical protein
MNDKHVKMDKCKCSNPKPSGIMLGGFILPGTEKEHGGVYCHCLNCGGRIGGK